jgi:hypothetical protein
MAQTAVKSFNYRAFVSVLVGLSFFLMTVTGAVLFFAPSCRIARDTSWSVLGYDKDQWIAVHVWTSLAFVLASVFHVYFNWRAMMNYFKSKITKHFAFRAEWIAALVLCAIVYAGTIYEVPPFSSLMVWKETFKHEGPGPGGHGRGRQGQAREHMIESTVDEQPQADIRGEEHTPGAGRDRGGFGMGQKTLSQFCDEEGIDLSSAMSRLRNEGFTVQETMTMRQIADSKGVHPRELRDILQPEHSHTR